MTNRPEQLDDLSAYLDGELEPAERDRVERLIKSDPGAKTVLEELRATTRLVSALPRAHAPATLAEAVTARLERDALLDERATGTARRLAIYQWTRRFSVAAVLVIAATVGWHYWHTDPVIGPPSSDLPIAEHSAARESRKTAPPGSPSEIGVGRDETHMKKGGPVLADAAEKGSLADDATWSNQTGSFENKAQFTLRTDADNAPRFEVKDGEFVGGPGVQVALADASRQFIESPKVGNVELEIRRNALSNSALQRAPVTEVARQVRVTGDASATQQVEQKLLTFMASNSIANLEQEAPSDPVNPERAFFVQQQAIDAGADDAQAVNYVINVPSSKAEELVEMLNDAAFENDAAVELEADGNVWQRESPSQQVAQSLDSLTAQNETVRTQPMRSGEVQSKRSDPGVAEKRGAGAPPPPAQTMKQEEIATRDRLVGRSQADDEAPSRPASKSEGRAAAKSDEKAEPVARAATEAAAAPSTQTMGKGGVPRVARGAQQAKKDGEEESDVSTQRGPIQSQQARAPSGATAAPVQTMQRVGGDPLVTLAIRLQVAPGSQRARQFQTFRQSQSPPTQTAAPPATQSGGAP